jgi:hypothetical protein
LIVVDASAIWEPSSILVFFPADDIPAGGVTAMLKKIARKERTIRIILRKCDVNYIQKAKTITQAVIIGPKK